MTELDDLRVEPVPGSGLAARGPGWVAFISAPASDPPTRLLLELLLAASPGDGIGLMRDLGRHVITAEPGSVPGFCSLAVSGERIAVMVHGMVSLTNGDEVAFRGDDRPTWADGFLDWRGLDASIQPSGEPTREAQGVYELTEGFVPAGGLVLTASERLGVPDVPSTPSPSVEPAPPEPNTSDDVSALIAAEAGAEAAAEPPSEQRSFEVVDLTILPEQPLAPLPTNEEPTTGLGQAFEPVMVTGVHCSRGHFNHPEVRFCAHCGINMVHLTKQAVTGPRPPLGFLVLDDGTTFSLDHGYVIGREPTLDPRVAGGDLRPLLATDSENTVSRIHAEVKLDGWDVLVEDRQSSNGTFVRVGEGPWDRIEPGSSHPLEPRAEISVGERRFVFESNVVPR